MTEEKIDELINGTLRRDAKPQAACRPDGAN